MDPKIYFYEGAKLGEQMLENSFGLCLKIIS